MKKQKYEENKSKNLAGVMLTSNDSGIIKEAQQKVVSSQIIKEYIRSRPTSSNQSTKIDTIAHLRRSSEVRPALSR